MAITTTKPNYRRRALVMALVAGVVVYILWNVPALEFIVSPLRLFVTYVHEAGHSLAALLTGGQVHGFLVSPDGSGLATTAGGTRAIVIAAGYLGAAFFGAALFFMVNRLPRAADAIAFALGLGMIAFTVLFARPDEGGAITALIIGVLFGAALMVVGWRANTLITVLVLDVLAIMTALNAVLDVWLLVQYADVAARGSVTNDAATFSRDIAPALSPAVVAFIWSGTAVVMMGLAIWFGVVRPLKREINESYDKLTGE